MKSLLRHSSKNIQGVIYVMKSSLTLKFVVLVMVKLAILDLKWYKFRLDIRHKLFYFSAEITLFGVNISFSR